MQDSPSDSDTPARRPRLLWTAFKWVLFVAVVCAVGYQGWILWNDDRLASTDFQAVVLHYGWLAAAVVLYIAAWIPALIYWRWLLRAVGDQVPLLQVARAYYTGHLGKYVPGKAGVILIRATMIAGAGGRFGRAALTAGYEALTTIGTGIAVAVMLAPWIFPDFVAAQNLKWLLALPGYPYIVPLLVAAVCLALLPVTAKLFARVAGKFAGTDEETTNDTVLDTKPISSGLLLRGSLMMIVCWCMHGLSLGCIIRGTGGASFDLSQWPFWTATVAGAISGGFLAVFAPGGLGVREGLLIIALDHQIGPKQAVAVAVIMRLVSIIGELGATAGLWKFGPRNSGAKQ